MRAQVLWQLHNAVFHLFDRCPKSGDWKSKPMCKGDVPDEPIEYPDGSIWCRQCKRAEVWVRRADDLAVTK